MQILPEVYSGWKMEEKFFYSQQGQLTMSFSQVAKVSFLKYFGHLTEIFRKKVKNTCAWQCCPFDPEGWVKN
jgi:hypothetical protein